MKKKEFALEFVQTIPAVKALTPYPFQCPHPLGIGDEKGEGRK